jgi:inner membrane protein
VVAFVVGIGAFAGGSRQAKAQARSAIAEALPHARTVDVSVTPIPADPLCWNVYWVGVDGEDYVVRLGRAAIAPARAGLPGGHCAFGPEPDTTAPMTKLATASSDPHAHGPAWFYAEYRRPLAQLTALAATRCEAAALLQFARVPYVTDPDADGSRVAGDLRYDRNPGIDFADVRLPAEAPRPEDCPPNRPPWIPPRAELLQLPH